MVNKPVLKGDFCSSIFCYTACNFIAFNKYIIYSCPAKTVCTKQAAKQGIFYAYQKKSHAHSPEGDAEKRQICFCKPTDGTDTNGRPQGKHLHSLRPLLSTTSDGNS